MERIEINTHRFCPKCKTELPDNYEGSLCAICEFQISKPKLKQHDSVNHPLHYTSHPSGVECIDIVEWLPFNIGSAIKYLWRCGLKTPNDIITQVQYNIHKIEELSKAKWYIEREIQRLGDSAHGELLESVVDYVEKDK